jgi:hypothetical protein
MPAPPPPEGCLTPEDALAEALGALLAPAGRRAEPEGRDAVELRLRDTPAGEAARDRQGRGR